MATETLPSASLTSIAQAKKINLIVMPDGETIAAWDGLKLWDIARGGTLTSVASAAARTALTPNAGDHAIQTDDNTFWVYSGSAWVEVIAAAKAKRQTLVLPVKDNDSTIAVWAPGAAISITGISFVRSETAAATLTVSIAKITAATAGDAVDLTTAENIAGGTNSAVQALGLDEVGGDLPIAVTAAQALLFTVAAGNGTVAPLAVTFFIDYV